MPVSVLSMGRGRYRVKTPNAIHAKSTTKRKAMAQARLLNAVEHSDWRPTGRPKAKRFKKMSRGARRSVLHGGRH